MGKLSIGAGLAGMLLAGCGGEAGQAGRLGVEGASCLRTADCESPLQCLGNVCARAGEDATSAADHPFGLDVLYGNEPGTDPGGDPGHEAGADPGHDPGPDPGKFDYGPLPDVDLDLGEDVTASPPDVPVTVPDAFGDCEALGIAASWSGAFEGTVEYDLKGKGYGLGVNDTDVLDVSGSLAFEIKCLEKKLTVVGSLNGVATSPTQIGSNPFAIKIGGSYNTKTKAIAASLMEGEVKLWGIVGVYFEGTFNGSLLPGGSFVGTWDGIETGNQLNWDVDASGDGTWTADDAS